MSVSITSKLLGNAHVSLYIRDERSGIVWRQKREDKPFVSHLEHYAPSECPREQVHAWHQGNFVKRRLVHLYDFAERYPVKQ